MVELLGFPQRIAATVAAASSQVGEFTFVLVALGVSLGLVTNDALQVVVAAALITITLNPFMFRAVDPAVRRLDQVGFPTPLRRRTQGT